VRSVKSEKLVGRREEGEGWGVTEIKIVTKVFRLPLVEIVFPALRMYSIFTPFFAAISFVRFIIPSAIGLNTAAKYFPEVIARSIK
jgi:hypothetical protein